MSIEKLLTESLKDQQKIFGDFLFETVMIQESVPQLKEEVSYNLNLNKKTVKEPEVKIQPVEQQAVLSYNELTNISSISDLESAICNCQKCELGKKRTKFVFGTGNPDAGIMIIGEAPGADEDIQGKPFVGKAGQLLTDILKAIKLDRDEDVFIANILKCRPPGNRDPQPVEMKTCLPYLYKQIEIIKPKAILCLGRIAANGLMGTQESLTRMRGNIYEVLGIKMMVTYHPAALLRNPNWKRGCWEDVQKFRKLYDELTA